MLSEYRSIHTWKKLSWTLTLTTNLSALFAFPRVALSAHFLNLPYMQLICHVCNSLYSFGCFSFCFAVRFALSLSLLLSLSFFLSPVACLPSLHLFTNIGGRKEGSMQTFGLSYPPHTRPASAPQEAACSTCTHRFQSFAHSIRMARKLDWHLNNRINGAYGLSVNTVTM